MGKKKNNKNNKNNKINNKNPILIFFVTFSVVLLIGLTGVLIGVRLRGKTGGGGAEEIVRSVFAWETISEEEKVRQAEAVSKEMEEYAELLQDTEYLRENRIYGVTEDVEGEVKMLFAGDILFDDEYAVMGSAIRRGGTVESAFSPELLDRMQAADILAVNNEFPFTDRGAPTEGKQFTFRADPDKVSWLSDMGVDVVSLANNHTFDFGEVGLLDTLATLETAAMPYIGAGRNIGEAAAPVYFMTKNVKIGIIAATQIERLDHPDTRGATEASSGVFRCWNPELLYQVVEETKKNCDFLVVFIHWGTENTSELDWAQLEQAPKIAEAGADLIIGAHPHCLQQIDYVKGIPVVYSLGNFWFNSKTLDTGMVEVIINKEGIKSLQFVPVLQSDCRSTLLTGEEEIRVLNVMKALSPGIAMDDAGFITGGN